MPGCSSDDDGSPDRRPENQAAQGLDVIGSNAVSILPLPIHGNRVTIQRLEERDLEDLYALDSDPDVKSYVGGPVRRTKDEFISGMRAKLGAEVCPLAIVLKDDASFIGRDSLAKIPLTMTSRPLWDVEWEIQVLVARKYWGSDFGREVVDILTRVALSSPEVSSVVGIVDPENRASLHLMETLGFQKIGENDSGGWDHGHWVFRPERPNT